MKQFDKNNKEECRSVVTGAITRSAQIVWARKDNGINDEWMMKNTTERERVSEREGGSQGRIKVTWSSNASSTATLCGVDVDVIRGWGNRLGSFLGIKPVSTHKKLNIRQRLTFHSSRVGSRANKRIHQQFQYIQATQ